MFLWNFVNPERDGALENDIVTHENTHGISNRMTGGGTGRYVRTRSASAGFMEHSRFFGVAQLPTDDRGWRDGRGLVRCDGRVSGTSYRALHEPS